MSRQKEPYSSRLTATYAGGTTVFELPIVLSGAEHEVLFTREEYSYYLTQVRLPHRLGEFLLWAFPAQAFLKCGIRDRWIYFLDTPNLPGQSMVPARPFEGLEAMWQALTMFTLRRNDVEHPPWRDMPTAQYERGPGIHLGVTGEQMAGMMYRICGVPT